MSTQPLITCIMPTFNRYPSLGWLVEEAVQSFLLQDYPNCELIIHNDSLENQLHYSHPRVRVLNTAKFPDLSSKIQYCIEQGQGDYFCRWDDDDINLPWRLSYSLPKVQARGDLEWRPKNYWFDVGHLSHNVGHANCHVTALWSRKCLELIGGVYPPKFSGYEDQAFNQALEKKGLPKGELIPKEDVFYLYRWSTGAHHLSGVGGSPENLQAHFDKLGKKELVKDKFIIKPRWYRNHAERARMAAAAPARELTYDQIGGYFNYQAVYDEAVASVPRHGRLVEVGCFYGRSLIYLADVAKKHGKRLSIFGVDLGVGALQEPAPREGVYKDTAKLLSNIKRAGHQDIVTLLAGESTAAAEAFADNSLDFVMIDDDHTYPSVVAGLQAWWPKVKRGGTLAVHDYGHPDFPDVPRAVDSFFGVPSLTLRHSKCRDVAWKRKA